MEKKSLKINEEAAQKKAAIVCKSVPDFSKFPFAVKKADEARKSLENVVFPEEMLRTR